jgi:hypothetical protein
LSVTFSGFQVHRRVTAHELGQCYIILITNAALVVYRQLRVIPSNGLRFSVSVLVGRGGREGERGKEIEGGSEGEGGVFQNRRH